MESIDKLIVVSKHLYDHRVADQRNTIEKLNEKIQELNDRFKTIIDIVKVDKEDGWDYAPCKMVIKWGTGKFEFIFSGDFTCFADSIYKDLSSKGITETLFYRIKIKNNILEITLRRRNYDDSIITLDIDDTEINSFLQKIKAYATI